MIDIGGLPIQKSIIKGLTVAVVFLFICVAFSPTINSYEIEKEYVKLTTEICGVEGAQPQTIKLTRQESEEIDVLFDEIKIKLDNANSYEDTKDVLKWAIIELDKFNLLGGLSIDEAKKIVIPKFNTHQISPLRNREYQSNTNAMCLIAGEIYGSWILWGIIPSFIASLIFRFTSIIETPIGKILDFLINLDPPYSQIVESLRNLLLLLATFLFYGDLLT